MAGRRQGDSTATNRRHHIRGNGISREAEYHADHFPNLSLDTIDNRRLAIDPATRLSARLARCPNIHAITVFGDKLIETRGRI